MFRSSGFKLYNNAFKCYLKPNALTISKFQCRACSYEEGGRTTITILNKKTESSLFIDSYSSAGFRFSNGLVILGSIILFSRSILSWHVSSPLDVTKDSLCLFHILEPKPDIFIVGMGNQVDAKLTHEILQPLHIRGINVEILSTERAIGYYNFLNNDGRNIAAALIPPTNINITDTDIVNTRVHEKFFERSTALV